FRHKDRGVWRTWTWSELLLIVRAYAVGLSRLGLKRGDTVAIVGGNRPRIYWTIAAAQSLGCVPVPVYSDAVAEEVAYVLDFVKARFAIAQDQEQVDKLLGLAERLPMLEQVLYDEERGLSGYDRTRLHSIETIIADGRTALSTDLATEQWLDE